ncbi:MAG: response regulator [Candidatus Omnitrophota bacterium]
MQHKILFVDDEASLRRTMALGLSQRGFDTEPCENGMTALKKLESFMKNNVNLKAVVVDIRLPDIDGIKLVKIIKFRYPGIPVVLITGYADRYNREEIRNLQVNAFLEKPFTPDELTEQFLKIMENEQAVEEPSLNDEKIELKSESAYLLVRMDDDADILETYKSLYYMENVLYCDATKGDYDAFMLLQADTMKELAEMGEKVKQVPGVKSVDFMGVDSPVLDESTASIIDVAEDALSDESSASTKTRDMSNRVCSYILMDVEREKLDEVYPTVRLNENVVYCDYTTGKYNLVLFVTGHYFDEIDKFIQQTLVNMTGVLKVKEYPIVSLFEM